MWRRLVLRRRHLTFRERSARAGGVFEPVHDDSCVEATWSQLRLHSTMLHNVARESSLTSSPSPYLTRHLESLCFCICAPFGLQAQTRRLRDPTLRAVRIINQ